ncbi:MAG: hypothetical protein ACM359_21110 [Bacillota bacterium]
MALPADQADLALRAAAPAQEVQELEPGAPLEGPAVAPVPEPAVAPPVAPVIPALLASAAPAEPARAPVAVQPAAVPVWAGQARALELAQAPVE